MAESVTIPTVHPGSEGGNHSSSNSGGSNYAQQEPGQDPGSSSSSSHPQHPVVARPVFYIHAPPPPPFLQYQWPVPFSYNPFAGFPAMSYGMIVPPPPPPPPFMETPAYFLPHPHMQPVDYRRFIHPQGHTPGGSHQNSSQTRRIRPPHTVHARGTVNSEVQTEPIQRGGSIYDAGSDSGRGTGTNSPCSPGSGSQKQASAEVVKYKFGHSEVEACTSSNVTHVLDKRPAGVKRCMRASQEMEVGQESRPCPDSPNTIVPVCSSSQKDGVYKRRISVPDILMGWGGDAPQATTKVSDEEVLAEHQQCHKSIYQGLNTNTSGDQVLSKIVRLPCALTGTFLDPKGDAGLAESTCTDELLYLPISSQKVSEESDPHDVTEIAPYKVRLSSSRVMRLDESVWSVESLTPVIPTRDWLLQNGMFELMENEDVGHDKVACQEGRCTFPASDSPPFSGSWLDFQTPLVKQSPPKQPGMESDDPNIGEQDKTLEKDPPSSPTALEDDTCPPCEEENGSPEPNQETDSQEKNLSLGKESLLLNSAAETIQPVTRNSVEVDADRCPLTVQMMTEVSQSRGQLVDCGVQCSEIWQRECSCENLELNGKPPFKNPDLKKTSKSNTSGNVQKKRNGQWRNRGGNGRNSRQ